MTETTNGRGRRQTVTNRRMGKTNKRTKKKKECAIYRGSNDGEEQRRRLSGRCRSDLLGGRHLFRCCCCWWRAVSLLDGPDLGVLYLPFPSVRRRSQVAKTGVG